MALPGRGTGHEETREARADLPHKHGVLLKGECDEAPAIGRERTRGRPLLVPLENIQPRRRLQIVHHDRTLTRPNRKPLCRAVEVHCRVAARQRGKKRETPRSADRGREVS